MMINKINMILVLAIIFGSIIVAIAIYKKPEGRYSFAPSSPSGVLWIIDTRTGKIYLGSCNGKFEGNFVNKTP